MKAMILISLAMLMAGVFPARIYPQDGRVLMRVDGRNVTKAEYEAFCRQAGTADEAGREPDGRMDAFVSLMLKAADARACGWDTLPTFRQECKVRQAERLRTCFVDAAKADSLCRLLYARSLERLSAKGWVKVEEASVRLSQHASGAEEQAARQHLDSVYRALQQGEPFGRFVTGERGGTWYPAVSLLKEFAGRLENLSPGQYTEPFSSPLGMHILRLVERRQSPDYETMSNEIHSYIDSYGCKNPSLCLDEYNKWFSGEQFGVSSDAPNCFYEDQLLAAYWDKAHAASASPQVDEADLERYFNRHRERYDWEFPHYKGAVIHCADKKVASRIRKRLKKLPLDVWRQALERMQAEDPAVQADMQAGLFRIGSNPYIDKLAFKCGSLPENPPYPYTFILGKRLKKSPETYRDVRDAVERDYRHQLADEQTEALKQRFRLEMYPEVLKTVNCSGSN